MEIALILAAVLMISRIYAEYLTRGRDELCEFRDFLEKMNLRVIAYLDTGTDFAQREDFPALCRVRFIDGLGRGASLFEAFSECMPRLSISKSDKTLLYDFFREYGKADMNTEVNRCEKIIGALDKRGECARTEIEKKIKVFTSVTLAVCLGLVILII